MNNYPKRKPNRLKSFDYSSNGLYFITICTKDMKCVLSTIVGADTIRPQNNASVGADTIRPQNDEYKPILSELGKIVDKSINSMQSHYDNISVDKYVIMPNHIHLILKIENTNGRMVSAPTAIGSLKRFVTMKIGYSIWQKGFYDRVIRNDSDYINHLQYIEDNPKMWILGKDEYYS